jgi:hypothetical protein
VPNITLSPRGPGRVDDPRSSLGIDIFAENIGLVAVAGGGLVPRRKQNLYRATGADLGAVENLDIAGYIAGRKAPSPREAVTKSEPRHRARPNRLAAEVPVARTAVTRIPMMTSLLTFAKVRSPVSSIAQMTRIPLVPT